MQWVSLVVIGALVVYTVLRYRHNTEKLLSKYGDELRAYNRAAFEEVVEESPDEHFSYVTRLATEIESRRGQRAVFVQSVDGGTAIQHINQNGTFSAKGPYFVSWRSQNWHPTGRRHLVKVLRGKGRWGVKPDHYNQRGIIREKGIAVLEYETERHPPLDIRDFVRQRRK